MDQTRNQQTTPIPLRPVEVWRSLTQAQQNAILQTLVRICQHLARRELGEVEDEPERND